MQRKDSDVGSKQSKTPYYIRTVTTLPEKLYIVGMAKSDVSKYMHSLVNVLFFSKSKRTKERWFISLTETPDEISLILEEESIKQFPPDSIQVVAEPWLAIQFTMGSSLLETQGFIGDIAQPLGKAGINIFVFTTFNSDYILVEESKYHATRQCIESNFPIVWVDYESIESEISKEQVHKSPDLQVGLEGIHQETFPKLQAFPELPLVLTRISRSKLETCVADLIELIFYGSNPFRFISFTQTEDEVSLIIDTRTLNQFPKEKLQVVLNEETWIPIMRTQKSGFSEIGVVSAIATPLTHMSMLYLSSYKTGWFMVTSEAYGEAVSKLQAANFVVSTKKQEKQRRSLELEKTAVV